jgi:uncharacterized SAM-binding protein YcdF (DUF218 family)
MEFLLSKLLPIAVYPLGLALLLQIGGLAAGRRHRRRGAWLSGAGLALLWVAAMPLTARQLVRQLEDQASGLTPDPLPRADAVLVLGGGLRPALPPRRGVEVNEAGDRLLTGVSLVRRGLAPVLVVSGGRVGFNAGDPAPSEADTAARLAGELGVPADRIVRSGDPRNTGEEAEAIDRLARARGWRSLLLVTSASHLPRSLATFERRTRLRITPVATDFLLPARGAYGTPTLASVTMDLLPSASALELTTQMLKEHLGRLAYRWRGWE